MPTSPEAAPQEKCPGFTGTGEHKWLRVYQGATLDVYKCTNLCCGQSKTTKGTVARG